MIATIISIGIIVFFFLLLFIWQVKKSGLIERKIKYLLLIPVVIGFPYWLGIVQSYITLKTLNLETEFSEFKQIVNNGFTGIDAIKMLGELKDPRAIDILINILKDASEELELNSEIIDRHVRHCEIFKTPSHNN